MSTRSRATERGPGAAGRRAHRNVALLFTVLAGTAVMTTTACNDDGPTQPEVVGTLIGPEGGTVTVEDVTLAIPAGALDEDTDIVIENVGDAAYTADPFYIDGTAHRIKPEGLALDGGATLTIRYQAGDIPPEHHLEHLRITERTQDKWREMAQNRVRTQQQAVEAHIERFGTYGMNRADPDKLQVASVVVEPASLSLALEETGQLEATAFCEHGVALERVFTWSTDDEGVATVDETGLVTGVAEGNAVVAAETEGVSGTADVTVVGTVASMIVSPATFSIFESETQQLSAEAYDGNDNVLARTFTWSSSDESIATVDADGLVQALLPGKATISAEAEGVSGSAEAEVDPVIESIVVSAATSPIRNTSMRWSSGD